MIRCLVYIKYNTMKIKLFFLYQLYCRFTVNHSHTYLFFTYSIYLNYPFLFYRRFPISHFYRIIKNYFIGKNFTDYNNIEQNGFSSFKTFKSYIRTSMVDDDILNDFMVLNVETEEVNIKSCRKNLYTYNKRFIIFFIR